MGKGHAASTGVYRHDRQAGFLLVEVLATMTISALLLAALFSITSMTLRASARIERQTQQIEMRIRLLSALAREIQRAVPARWAGRNAGFIFMGDRQRVAFATELPSPGGATETVAVFIDGAKAITRRVAIVDPAASSFAELAIGRPEPLSNGELRLAFAYFARLADGREALVETWPDARQYPVAVQVMLSDRAGERSTMRVRLNVDAEPGCDFPDSGRCSLRAAKTQNIASSVAIGGGG
jgi:type II secretory pathway pseudopilin PulG